jgi:uncharacterized protein involved in exopolysaccharide biosynthesis
MSTIWRYRYVVAASVLLCALIAAAFALAAVPIYRAEVVVVEAEEGGLGGAAALAGQLGGIASLAGLNVNLGNGGAGAQGRAILESRSLVEEFLKRNKLLPVLAKNSAGLTTTWRGVEYFRDRVVTVRKDLRKGVTTVSLDWTDPKVAADWANGFVAMANEITRKRAIDDSSRNVAYLNSQLVKTDVVELRKVIFNIIESETKKLMLANGRAEYAFEVVDPAVAPEVRISPRRTLSVLVGAAIGAFLGILIAFILEARKRKKARSAAA